MSTINIIMLSIGKQPLLTSSSYYKFNMINLLLAPSNKDTSLICWGIYNTEGSTQVPY